MVKRCPARTVSPMDTTPGQVPVSAPVSSPVSASEASAPVAPSSEAQAPVSATPVGVSPWAVGWFVSAFCWPALLLYVGLPFGGYPSLVVAGGLWALHLAVTIVGSFRRGGGAWWFRAGLAATIAHAAMGALMLVGLAEALSG